VSETMGSGNVLFHIEEVVALQIGEEAGLGVEAFLRSL